MNIFKKKNPQKTKIKSQDNCLLNKSNMFNNDLEHLDKNDNLPFGWFSVCSDIKEMDNKLGILIDKYVILEKSNSSVDDKIKSINDVISYLRKYKTYCYNKNECYIKYFSDHYEHCYNSRNPDFTLISNYQGFLKELLDNYDDLKLRENLLKTLSNDLFKYIKENDNIMQKDIYKAFDNIVKDDIQTLLYQWDKNDIIKRKKEGNSYLITIK